MTDLITRLEQAAEGSRDLDLAIEKAFERCDPPELLAFPLPHYTTSLDAALTLVPEGWAWDLMAWPNEPSEAAICQPGSPHLGRWKGATPALALCIAALRASPQ